MSETSVIRGEIAAAGRVYPLGLRARVLAHLAQRREAGATVVEVADELGIGNDSLYRWRRGRSGFVPVEVIDATPGRTFTLRAPGDLVISGLSMEELVELVRRLA